MIKPNLTQANTGIASRLTGIPHPFLASSLKKTKKTPPEGGETGRIGCYLLWVRRSQLPLSFWETWSRSANHHGIERISDVCLRRRLVFA